MHTSMGCPSSDLMRRGTHTRTHTHTHIYTTVAVMHTHTQYSTVQYSSHTHTVVVPDHGHFDSDTDTHTHTLTHTVVLPDHGHCDSDTESAAVIGPVSMTQLSRDPWKKTVVCGKQAPWTWARLAVVSAVKTHPLNWDWKSCSSERRPSTDQRDPIMGPGGGSH